MNQNTTLKIALLVMGLVLVYVLFILLPQQRNTFNAQLDQAKQLTDQASSTAGVIKQDNQKTQQQIATVSSHNTFASVIKKWGPKVAQITCNFRDVNGNIYETSSGSASAVTNSNDPNNIQHGVLTNLHVLRDGNIFAHDCDVKFLNDPNTINISNPSDLLMSANNIDAVILKIENPDLYILSLPPGDKNNKCQQDPDLGDEVVILGYPGIGSNRSITATEGIISGFEDNDYVTSAKVEHGNSGGVAILVKNDCTLGIPSFAESGSVESLARILKWQVISLLH